jgi:hypothetical protein
MPYALRRGVRVSPPPRYQTAWRAAHPDSFEGDGRGGGLARSGADTGRQDTGRATDQQSRRDDCSHCPRVVAN